MRRLGAPDGEEHGLAESLPGWRAFPEVRAALGELRRRGWKLAILSNTDDDFIAASQVQIGIVFDEVVVAQEIGSYKPAHRHWEEFTAARQARREGHVHVAAIAVPRHRAGERARANDRLDQPARRERAPTAHARHGSCRICPSCRRRSLSSPCLESFARTTRRRWRRSSATAFGEARRLDAREVASWLRDPDLRQEHLRVLEEDGRVVGYCDVAPRNDALFVDLAAPGRWGELLGRAEGQAPPTRPSHVEPLCPVWPRARGDRRRAWLRRTPPLTDDGDRAREAAASRRRRRARAPRLPGRGPRRADRRDQRRLRRGPVLAACDAAEISGAVPRRRSATTRRCGFSSGTETSSSPSRSTIPNSAPTQTSAGSAGSAFASRGDGVAWAEALLRHSFAELYARGKRRVGLGVDAQNVTGALRLYERVGMRAVRRYGIWQKEL